ncbi:MAG: dihydrofolate reductase family protein [Bacteroidetes bacterium]|nr:dihydrofolate reductase family protein [Bacteroidota bacterium]MDA1121895.1 dihydrofolate reductase family protein [Bacteroidota bacterium]
MRKIILGLASSLDGYIEGPNGEIDWCFTDQDYGMKEFLSHVDTSIMGRKTYELTQTLGGNSFPNLQEYVFSKSLKSVKEPALLVDGDLKTEIDKIKSSPGKDIWLFGGAEFTTSLMNLGFVNEIWLSVHPVVLGGGKSIFIDLKNRANLNLTDTKTYPTGLVSLTYHIRH